jgi:putative nucleotidyltransferase with HDIG domain
MRKINVNNLAVGMIVAKPLYTYNSVFLLSEGAVLTEKYITKILESDLEYIFINDDISKDISIDNVVSEETIIETKKVLERSIGKLKSSRFNANPAIIDKVEAIVNEVLLNPKVMVSLQEIRNKSDYLLMHSINVCILSLLFAKKLNYTGIPLKHLAMGAMLHDIGKTKINFNWYRNKIDYLEEELEIYKTHSEAGYEIMKAANVDSSIAALIVRTHHEKYDGTGYPLKQKKGTIHLFSRIVAVADEYDNLLYNQPEGRLMKHFEIIEDIMARAFTDFDPEIVKVFLETISPYEVSTGVLLSDGRRGIVSKLNPHSPTMPIVRIINQETMSVIEELDLSQNVSISIIDEIDIDK